MTISYRSGNITLNGVSYKVFRDKDGAFTYNRAFESKANRASGGPHLTSGKTSQIAVSYGVSGGMGQAKKDDKPTYHYATNFFMENGSDEATLLPTPYTGILNDNTHPVTPPVAAWEQTNSVTGNLESFVLQDYASYKLTLDNITSSDAEDRFLLTLDHSFRDANTFVNGSGNPTDGAVFNNIFYAGFGGYANSTYMRKRTPDGIWSTDSPTAINIDTVASDGATNAPVGPRFHSTGPLGVGHGLIAGDNVLISGYGKEINLSGVSGAAASGHMRYTYAGHDLQVNDIVTISGGNTTNGFTPFNGTNLVVTEVVAGSTFDIGAQTSTGSPTGMLVTRTFAACSVYNGLFAVTSVPDANQFDIGGAIVPFVAATNETGIGYHKDSDVKAEKLVVVGDLLVRAYKDATLGWVTSRCDIGGGADPMRSSNWTAGIGTVTVGDVNQPITALIAVGDGEIVCKPEGVYVYVKSKGAYLNEIPELTEHTHPDNGKGAMQWKGWVYIPTIVGLLRYRSGIIQDVSPAKDTSKELETPVGPVAGLTGDSTRLYAITKPFYTNTSVPPVDAGSSYLQAYIDRGDAFGLRALNSTYTTVTTGVSTGLTQTVLTDTAASFGATNAQVGRVVFVGGVSSVITASTGTTLTFATLFGGTMPAAGATYAILMITDGDATVISHADAPVRMAMPNLTGVNFPNNSTAWLYVGSKVPFHRMSFALSGAGNQIFTNPVIHYYNGAGFTSMAQRDYTLSRPNSVTTGTSFGKSGDILLNGRDASGTYFYTGIPTTWAVGGMSGGVGADLYWIRMGWDAGLDENVYIDKIELGLHLTSPSTTATGAGNHSITPAGSAVEIETDHSGIVFVLSAKEESGNTRAGLTWQTMWAFNAVDRAPNFQLLYDIDFPTIQNYYGGAQPIGHCAIVQPSFLTNLEGGYRWLFVGGQRVSYLCPLGNHDDPTSANPYAFYAPRPRYDDLEIPVYIYPKSDVLVFGDTDAGMPNTLKMLQEIEFNVTNIVYTDIEVFYRVDNGNWTSMGTPTNSNLRKFTVGSEPSGYQIGIAFAVKLGSGYAKIQESMGSIFKPVLRVLPLEDQVEVIKMELELDAESTVPGGQLRSDSSSQYTALSTLMNSINVSYTYSDVGGSSEYVQILSLSKKVKPSANDKPAIVAEIVLLVTG